MKKLVLGSIACVALAAGPALAADLRVKAPIYKAPEVQVYNWTGFYVGIDVGGGTARSNWDFGTFSTGSFSDSSGLFGVNVGFNYQAPGSPFVIGVEANFDWTNFNAGTTTFCPGRCWTRTTFLDQFLARAGYANGPNLVYVTGGLAAGDIKTGIGALDSDRKTVTGWSGGIGYEHSWTPTFTTGIRYLHTELTGGRCGLPVCDLIARVDQKVDAISVSFKVHLAWDWIDERGGWHASDARLKTDIVSLGHLDNGLAIYRFRYVDTEELYVGVMAQEVAMIRPDAVTLEDGYLLVDYGRLGLRMQTWEEWSTSSQVERLVSAH